MLNKYYTITLIGLFLLGFSSCRDRNVMSRQKMTDVLCDLQLAQALYEQRFNEYGSAEKKEAIINSVLEKHGINRAILDSSLVWYSDNVDEYMKVNDSVIARLNRKQIVLERIDSQNQIVKEVNYKLLPSYVFIDSKDPILSFSIDTFKLKEIDLPNFVFSFDVYGFSPERDKIEMSLLYEYSDTLVYINKFLYANGSVELKNTSPLDKNLRSISGFVKLSSQLKNSTILLNKINLKKENIGLDSQNNSFESAVLNNPISE